MNANTSPIRILSVDDHPIIRQGIAGLLSIQPDMIPVGEASDGREAIQLLLPRYWNDTIATSSRPRISVRVPG
jgi:DNA-binding NarL/FixJ family response regulator